MLVGLVAKRDCQMGLAGKELDVGHWFDFHPFSRTQPNRSSDSKPWPSDCNMSPGCPRGQTAVGSVQFLKKKSIQGKLILSIIDYFSRHNSGQIIAYFSVATAYIILKPIHQRDLLTHESSL